MRGFVGVLTNNGDPDTWKTRVREIISLISHRGPDDEGFYSNPQEGIYLGFKRLSIIDLSSKGHQPMLTEGATVSMVFNGEIYDFKDIRDEVVGKGFTSKSRADSEVVLRAYEQWGEEFVHKLRGMFAIAIWNAQAPTAKGSAGYQATILLP